MTISSSCPKNGIQSGIKSMGEITNAMSANIIFLSLGGILSSLATFNKKFLRSLKNFTYTSLMSSLIITDVA